MRINPIFFDRDGVINELVGADLARGPRNLEELRFNSDFIKVLQVLEEKDCCVIVITNQPDYSRGLLSLENNNLIKQKILSALPKGSIYLECLHDNSDGCLCRKPKPGLIYDAAISLGVPLDGSILVGDKWTDIIAGKAAGLTTILLENEASWIKSSQGSPPSGLTPDFKVNSLIELAGLLRKII